MDGLVSGAFRIDVVPGRGKELVLEWRGVSNDQNPRTALDPYLRAVLDQARASRAPIEMRFADLEYGNSSTLAAIIDFTQQALAARIKLIFVFSSARRWQRLSLEAMRVFEDETRNLELRQA